MATIDQLYAEFVQAWNTGLAPEVDPFLDRADPAAQAELAERIETFVMVAPSVEPTPERAAELQALPAFLRAAAIPEEDAAPAPAWATRLRAARERAGLSLRDLGSRLAEAFGVAGGEEKAARLLGELESGALPATGVSTRAADRLSDLLGLAAGALAPPRAQPLFRAGPAAPADAVGSPPPDDADFVADFALALDADEGWDDVDWLLRGGD